MLDYESVDRSQQPLQYRLVLWVHEDLDTKTLSNNATVSCPLACSCSCALIIIVIIMYIYHALINALSAHMIHINLNYPLAPGVVGTFISGHQTVEQCRGDHCSCGSVFLGGHDQCS